METKRSKYDTNPLDPDVARASEKVWGEEEDSAKTGNVAGATKRVGQNSGAEARAEVYSEAPTRTFDSPPTGDSSYPSVFVPPTYAPPAEVYQPPQGVYQRPDAKAPGLRHVEKLGLQENWAVALPYAPMYIGIVAAILELILVPRSEVRVRAHAAQGLALQMAMVAIGLLFGAIGAITGSSAGGSIFGFASFIFLVISMIRVYQGATHRISPLKDPAEWLNKHIEPRR